MPMHPAHDSGDHASATQSTTAPALFIAHPLLLVRSPTLPYKRNLYFTCTATCLGSEKCDPPKVLLRSMKYLWSVRFVADTRSERFSPSDFPTARSQV